MEPSNVSTSPSASDGKVDGKKRKVTPEQEAMKKRPKAANEVQKADDSANGNYKVCELVIQNLKAARGHAKTNYTVSMLVGKHGLFDLVVKVFHILQEEKLTYDQYYSHLWSVVFDGKRYHNGWRGRGIPEGPQDHVDDEDTRLLHTLGLKVGQKGKFEGESASFDFVVKKISGVPAKDVEYPKYSAIQTSFGSALSDDWISDDQKTECLQARDKWEAYYSGNNASKRDRRSRTFEIVACKPEAPQWDNQELELLGLLINAGHKFAKSWNTILQHALVSRPKSATSGQWYKLQKEAYRREWYGRGKSSAEMTLLAKRLAKSRVEHVAMPPTQAEILKERNKMIQRRSRLMNGDVSALFDDEF